MRTYRHGPGSYFAYFQRNENRFYRKSHFRFSQRVSRVNLRTFCWRRTTLAQDHTGAGPHRRRTTPAEKSSRHFLWYRRNTYMIKQPAEVLTYSIYDKKISAAEFITFANQAGLVIMTRKRPQRLWQRPST